MESNDYFGYAQLIIRRPVKEVFNAFTDPAVTTKFWFTHGSDVLAHGKKVIWKWEMYNLEVPVNVLEMIPLKKILIEWGAGEQASKALFLFEERGRDRTFVNVKSYGFKDQGDELIEKIRDTTGGFNLVLAAAKAWLEHGVELKVVEDKG